MRRKCFLTLCQY